MPRHRHAPPDAPPDTLPAYAAPDAPSMHARAATESLSWNESLTLSAREGCRETRLCQAMPRHQQLARGGSDQKADAADAGLSVGTRTEALPPLCCGGGPTGLVVRTLQRAEREAGGQLTVVLLEHPMLIIGRLWTAAKLCTNSLVVSQLGYFRTRTECVLATGACAAVT